MIEDDIDRRPTVISVGGGVLAGFGIVLIFAQYTVIATAIAGIGLLALTVGGYFGMREVIPFGTGMLILSLLTAGFLMVPPSALLAAGVFAVLSWDLLSNGLILGKQVGRNARTVKAELAHGGATLLGGTIVAASIFGIYSVSPGGWPLAALILALLAGLLFAIVLEY